MALISYCQNSLIVNCNENALFKKIFFDHITVVECYVLKETIPKDLSYVENFKSALNYICKYAHVSWEKTDGYSIKYPDYQDFLEDKNDWLKWYNSNRCNNLQVDTTLLTILPDFVRKALH